MVAHIKTWPDFFSQKSARAREAASSAQALTLVTLPLPSNRTAVIWIALLVLFVVSIVGTGLALEDRAALHRELDRLNQRQRQLKDDIDRRP